MSREYRQMIYFAVATLYLYRADLVTVRGSQTPDEFMKRNKSVIERVSAEAINLFNYELSIQQIGRAVAAYLAPAQSVARTQPAFLP